MIGYKQVTDTTIIHSRAKYANYYSKCQSSSAWMDKQLAKVLPASFVHNEILSSAKTMGCLLCTQTKSLSQQLWPMAVKCHAVFCLRSNVGHFLVNIEKKHMPQIICFAFFLIKIFPMNKFMQDLFHKLLLKSLKLWNFTSGWISFRCLALDRNTK